MITKKMLKIIKKLSNKTNRIENTKKMKRRHFIRKIFKIDTKAEHPNMPKLQKRRVDICQFQNREWTQYEKVLGFMKNIKIALEKGV